MLLERTGSAGTTAVLVDMSPDLREQLIGAEVTSLDAVLVTHEHADHTHGIDDLRPLVIHMRRRLPLYADEPTGALLRERFSYCFETPPGSSYPPILNEHRISIGEPIVIAGAGGPVAAMPFDMVHGEIQALGFRFGNLAYASDVSVMPEDSKAMLQGLDVLILDALRPAPHPTHFNVAEALMLIEELQPRRAILTDLHTDLDYDVLRRELPSHVEPAYDGMVIEGFEGAWRSERAQTGR